MLSKRNMWFSVVVLLSVLFTRSSAQGADNTSPLLPPDGSNAAVSESTRIIVATESELREELRRTRQSQSRTLVVDTTLFVLNNTVIITAASNLTIEGLSRGTVVRCPKDGGAFLLRNAHVRLRQLRFEGCRGSTGTLRIRGTTADIVDRGANMTTNLANGVTVESCTFENNRHETVRGGTRGGAAISASNTKLRIIDSAFHNNSADIGGALLIVESEVSVERSNFTENRATGDGGSIFAQSGTLQLEDVRVTNSSAGSNGGFLYTSSSLTTIAGMVSSNNSAEESGGLIFSFAATLDLQSSNVSQTRAVNGGAVYATNGTVIIKETTLVRNEATVGGSLFLSNDEVILVGVFFTEAFASDRGGAISAKNCKDIDLRRSIFVNNEARDVGGALDVNNCSTAINRSRFISNSARKGGGICIRRSSISINGTSFIKHRSNESGGALFLDSSEILLENCALRNNTAESHGGALSTVFTTVNVLFSKLSENEARKSGGALYLRESTIGISNSEILLNGADQHGGGMFSIGSTIRIDASTYRSNKASKTGGAIVAHNGYPFKSRIDGVNADTSNAAMTILDSEFTENFAETDGGAISSRSGRLRIERSDMKENQAGRRGGGVFGDDQSWTIESCNFSGNVATSSGGATFLRNVIGNIADVEFIGNSAVGDGGAMGARTSRLVINNATFTGDKSEIDGGAIHSVNTSMMISSSDFRSEFAKERGGAVFLFASEMTLNFVDVIDCKASEQGGGVFVTRATVFIVVSNFTGNSATTKGGGMAAVKNSTVSIVRTTFHSNSAETGGGLFVNNATMIVLQSTVEMNSAQDRGGGISVGGSNVTIASTTCTKNSAERFGGAVHARESAIYIEAVNFTTNSVNERGGGVFISESNATVIDSVFHRNQALRQGGGALFRAGDIWIRRTQFTENMAEDDGGAVMARLTSSLVVQDSNLKNNRAERNGGCLSTSYCGISIKRTTFHSNSVDERGGAIFSTTDTILLGNVIFVNNTAKSYAGAINTRLSNLTIEDGKFIKNNADAGGGAMYSKEGQVTIVDTRFIKNHARVGGGSIQPVDGTVVIRRSVFRSNTAMERGGAMYARNAKIKISTSQFKSNVAVEDGGALYPSDSDLEVSTTNFTDNSVTERGGAIDGHGGSATFIDSRFADNSAEMSGGSFHMRNQSLRIIGCVFKSNHAGGDAGAILFLGTAKSEVFINTSIFQSNDAKGSGGAILMYKARCSMLQTRFRENEAQQSGGAIYAEESRLKMNDTRFHGNEARIYGGAAFIQRSKSVIGTSSFEKNKGVNQGGAVYVQASDISLNSSTFITNEAVDSAGAIMLFRSRKSTLPTIIDCRFKENKAYIGGALQAHGVETTDIEGSTFTQNAAERGGGISVLDGELSVNNSVFSANTASGGPGGAISMEESTTLLISGVLFENNNAEFEGGAVSLAFASSFAIASGFNTVTFRNNKASKGGGLACLSCDRVTFYWRVVFESNSAVKSGGGMHLSDILGDAKILAAEFRNNSAPCGGGVTLQDCLKVTLGRGGSRKDVIFHENSAFVGGGLFIKSEHARQYENYTIRGSVFTHNVAYPQATSTLKANDSAVTPLFANMIETGRQRIPRGKCSGRDKSGAGGAIYLVLQNKRDSSAVSFHIRNLNITRNKAVVGGAIFVEQNPVLWDKVSRTECSPPGSPNFTACQYIGFDRVRVHYNLALLVAGGVFFQESKDLTLYCRYSTDSFVALNETERLRLRRCMRATRNNIIDVDNGYGNNYGTDAAMLRVSNINGTITNLRSGEILQPTSVNGTKNKEGAVRGILVLVKDHFDNTIKGGIGDSELAVVLRSSWISGQRRYVAHRGEIHIVNTSVVGIDLKETVSILTNDRREISVTVNFTTQQCLDGELPAVDNRECIRCDYANYTFGTVESCRKCEDNAFCIGTTVLVPEEGFWHSSPYSPVIRQCFVGGACSFSNRRDSLVAYYKNSTFVANELQNFEDRLEQGLDPFNKSQYNQCAPGYEGILCGSCSSDYGHKKNGQCERCTSSPQMGTFLTFVLALLLFTTLSLKVVLEIGSAREDALYEIAERQRVLVQYRSQEGSSDQPNASTSNHEQGNPGEIQLSVLEGRAPSPALSDKSPGHENHRRTPTLRRMRNIDDPSAFSDMSDGHLSTETIEAAALRTETYKIFFNFMQLNSVALSLNVEWRFGLKALLTAQNSIGRMTNFAELSPFECNFSNTKGDPDSPLSLTSLWYRACFPLMVLGVYIIVVVIWRLVRNTRVRKNEIDPIPHIISLCLLVFVSSVIDIFGEFLRLLNCVDLSAKSPGNHEYLIYDTTETRQIWVEDTAVTCWEGPHIRSAVFGGIGVSICAGLMVFMIAILFYGKRNSRLGHPQFICTYGFLYGSYRRTDLALYWELVITTRKMFFSVAGVYTQNTATSNIQLGILGAIIFLALWLHVIYQPFDHENSKDTFPSYARWYSLDNTIARKWMDRWIDFNQKLSLNDLEGASLLMSLSVFGTGMSMSNQVGPTTASDLIQLASFMANAMFTFFLCYRLYYAWQHYLDVSAKNEGILFQSGREDVKDDRNTWLLYKLWILIKRNPTVSKAIASYNAICCWMTSSVRSHNSSTVPASPTSSPGNLRDRSSVNNTRFLEEKDFENNDSLFQSTQAIV